MRQFLPFLGRELVTRSTRQCLDGHLARHPEENRNLPRLLIKKKMPALQRARATGDGGLFPSF